MISVLRKIFNEPHYDYYVVDDESLTSYLVDKWRNILTMENGDRLRGV